MADTAVISQLTLAVEWDTVGLTKRPNPLVAALKALGYEPASASVADVLMSVIQTGRDVGIDQLIAAAARKPGRSWETRVAACLHLLMDGDSTA